MILHFRSHDPPGRVGMPLAVMVHEAASEHVMTPVHILAVNLVGQCPVKPMVSGAQREDGSTRIDVVDDEFALLHRQGQEAREEQHQIGLRQQFQTRDVVFVEGFPLLGIHRHRGIHLALFIHREEHRAIEAMMLAQDLGQHGHRLFAPVLLISGHQDHPLAFAGSGFPRIPQPLLGVCGLNHAHKTHGQRGPSMNGGAPVAGHAANLWGFH